MHHAINEYQIRLDVQTLPLACVLYWVILITWVLYFIIYCSLYTVSLYTVKNAKLTHAKQGVFKIVKYAQLKVTLRYV